MKVKGKNTLEHAMKAQTGEWRYSSTLSLNSGLYESGGERHDPAAFPRERPGAHCIGGWVGPSADLSVQGRKTSPPPKFDPRTVQPVASRHTNYTVPANI